VASQLIGRQLKLKWTDFSGKPPGNKAQELDGATPGRSTFLAATASSFKATFGGADKPNFDGTNLRDDITVTIVFDQVKSWRVIDHLSDTTKGFLLEHEQGHYDITALMARDCFIELMQLKANAFASAADGTKEVLGLIGRQQTALGKVQTKYDWDTNHGTWYVPQMGPPTKGSEQVRWEGYIRRAFTDDRSPAMVAPDGASYKRRLVDVARDGISARNETCDF
jgi:hypothetical protein